MAEEDQSSDAEAQGGGEGDDAGQSGGKKKLLIIVFVALLLVIGGLAGAYFTGLLDPLMAMIIGKPHVEKSEGEAGPKGPSVFYELPAITVNLNTGARKARFIKIQVSLELEKETDKPIVEGVIARVMDNFNVYLRELRVEDLSGSAGMYRLREELLARIRVAVAPAKVRDILFKEMLIQ